LLEVFIKVKNDLVTDHEDDEFFGATMCPDWLSIESWTDVIVDQILFEGDKIYLNAFESRIIPDTDTLSHVFA